VACGVVEIQKIRWSEVVGVEILHVTPDYLKFQGGGWK